MIVSAVQFQVESDHNAPRFVHLPMRPRFVPNRVLFDYRFQILLDLRHLASLPH